MHPQAEQEVKFVRKFLLGGGELEAVSNLSALACVLRKTTKKVVNFLREKCHHGENPGYSYEQL